MIIGKIFGGIVFGSTFIFVWYALALAQSNTPNRNFTIDLPAQPLAASLTELSKQTGMQIFAAGELVKDKSAPAVSGRMTAHQALDRLLEGSGLDGEVSGEGFVIQPSKKASSELVSPTQPGIPTQSQITLDPVTVLGARGIDVPLSNVPASITVVDQNEIETELATTGRIEDVLASKYRASIPPMKVSGKSAGGRPRSLSTACLPMSSYGPVVVLT